MRNYIWIFLVVIIIGCSASKNQRKEQKYSQYKIISSTMVVEKDTIQLNELRFYKIQSALDGMKLMYDNYGKWNKKINAKHQQNINRIVWKNIRLIDGNNEIFTIIADGKETRTEHFASLMVFDSEEKDCFKSDHPYKEKLTELLVDMMNRIDKNPSVYKLFR